MNGGNKSVDFALAYADDGNFQHELRRATFEKHLEEVGLILERDTNQKKIHFVKIHAPHDVLCQYAEILKMRLPIKDVSKINLTFIF